MADFNSPFWSWFIIISTLVSIVGLFIFTVKVGAKKRVPGEKAESMGHIWDEDLYELNYPAPRWWYLGFLISMFWGVLYLFLYPGLGTFQGYLGWSQISQYEEEVAKAEQTYGPIFEQYNSESIEDLAANPEALLVGQRLFSTYCTTCHGSDARGARGFPNLTDSDWLYGGDAASIKTSILKGRQGAMPPWGALLKEEEIRAVAEYIRSLGGLSSDPELSSRGKTSYVQYCMVCHAEDGSGNVAMGSPNLVDDIWLYGGSSKKIIESIRDGRNGVMPPHENFLGEAKVHILAAYVYSLSR